MFRSQSSDHHQGPITVLVQLLLIGVHASSYSGMWLYIVCSSVHTMYLSVWCLVRVLYSGKHTFPLGKTRYPLYRRMGRPQGRSEQVRKILPPPGFNPRTVQPVASRYTYYATRPTVNILKFKKK